VSNSGTQLFVMHNQNGVPQQMNRYIVVDKQTMSNVYDTIPYELKRKLNYYNMIPYYEKCVTKVIRVLQCVIIILTFVMVFSRREFNMYNVSDNVSDNCEINNIYKLYHNDVLTLVVSTTDDTNGTDVDVSIVLQLYNDGKTYMYAIQPVDIVKDTIMIEYIIGYTYKRFFKDVGTDAYCYVNGTSFNFNGLTNNTIFKEYAIRPSIVARYCMICVMMVSGVLFIVILCTHRPIDVINSTLRRECIYTSYGVVYRTINNGSINNISLFEVPVTANALTPNVVLPLPSDPELVETDDSDIMCIICCTYETNVIIEPCGHKCMCHKCYSDMSRVYNQRKCPICRTPIDTISMCVRVYANKTDFYFKQKLIFILHN
jgi:hypothetical protein